jgi:DNA-binding SARP family transcriptional activator/predicted ATPase
MHAPQLLLPISEKPLVARAASAVWLPPRVAVTLLGSFSVSVNGAAIDAQRWRLKHPRLLWQMLCLAPGHRISRDEAADALWPRAGAQASSNRLHHTLHALRGIFSEAGVSDARQLVQLQAGTLRLDAGVALDLDLRHFARAVAAARASNGNDAAALVHLQRAYDIHRGALALPAGAGEWFTPHRKAALRDGLWLLEQLAQRYQAAGRIDDAARVGQALVQMEPSNEAAHRRLIELYEAQGRTDLVLQQYTACSRYLRRHLGIEPSAATQASMRRSSANQPREAASTAQRVRYVAPLRASPLLGREADLAALQRCLLEDGARLITLTAAGGVGKTRLCAALAERVQAHFGDGVYVVALGAETHVARLAERICQSLNIATAGQPAERVLPAALATRRLLLVLDCFEHLIGAAPRLSEWLRAAPQLHIVVTSQCALKSRAERVYEVPTLLTRAPQAAIDLFCLTAQRGGTALRLPDDEPVIRRICERVGGNALAIELAAAQLARVRLADVTAALAGAPLAFLAGAAPDGEQRHTSLEATIAWSCSLLAPAEASLLKLASVFAGDFSVEDVRAVLGGLFDAGTVTPMLRALMERHLLVSRIDPVLPDARRFAMLDAVQAFARGAAQADARWPQVQRLHADYFSRLARQGCEQRSKGKNTQPHSIFVVAAADFSQCEHWLREHATAEDYLQSAWQIAMLRLSFGSLRETIERLQEATRIPVVGRAESEQSARCHRMLAFALGNNGDVAGAMRSARAARALVEEDSTNEVLSERIDYLLADFSLAQLRFDPVLKYVDSSIPRLRRNGREDLLVGSMGMLAGCLAMRGDYARARIAAESAVDYAYHEQSPHHTLIFLLTLRSIETQAGRLDRAQETLRECMTLADAGYDKLGHVFVLLAPGALAFECGRFAEAGAHFALASAHAHQHWPGRATVATLWQEYVSMETGRESDVRLLLTLSDRALAFDSDFAVVYVLARTYRLRLQAERGLWPAAARTAARLQQLLRRSGNALWASWTAESAALVAHALGRTALARTCLSLSRELQAARGIVATPRQTASWARHELRLQQERPAQAPAADADGLAQALQQLLPVLIGLTREPLQDPRVDRLLSSARLRGAGVA